MFFSEKNIDPQSCLLRIIIKSKFQSYGLLLPLFCLGLKVTLKKKLALHYPCCHKIQMLVLSACMHTKSLQLCSTLCDPMGYSPPDSSVHGILQARILEWIAMPFFRDLPYSGIKPAACSLTPFFLKSSNSWLYLEHCWKHEKPVLTRLQELETVLDWNS